MPASRCPEPNPLGARPTSPSPAPGRPSGEGMAEPQATQPRKGGRQRLGARGREGPLHVGLGLPRSAGSELRSQNPSRQQGASCTSLILSLPPHPLTPPGPPSRSRPLCSARNGRSPAGGHAEGVLAADPAPGALPGVRPGVGSRRPVGGRGGGGDPPRRGWWVGLTDLAHADPAGVRQATRGAPGSVPGV